MTYDEIIKLKQFSASTKLYYNKYAYKIVANNTWWHISRRNDTMRQLMNFITRIESTYKTEIKTIGYLDGYTLKAYLTNKDAFIDIVNGVQSANSWYISVMSGATTPEHLKKLEDGGEVGVTYRQSLYYGEYTYSIRMFCGRDDILDLRHSISEIMHGRPHKVYNTIGQNGCGYNVAVFVNSYDDMIMLKLAMRDNVTSSMKAVVV